MHRQTVALAIAITLRLSSSASAQPLESSPRTQTDFSRVRLKVGDHVYVLDPERKVEVSGRLTRLSADELSVDGYQFVPKPGLKVERDGDTIWDGAALGSSSGDSSGGSPTVPFISSRPGSGAVHERARTCRRCSRGSRDAASLDETVRIHMVPLVHLSASSVDSGRELRAAAEPARSLTARLSSLADANRRRVPIRRRRETTGRLGRREGWC
jgi:hypothetical protein